MLARLSDFLAAALALGLATLTPTFGVAWPLVALVGALLLHRALKVERRAPGV